MYTILINRHKSQYSMLVFMLVALIIGISPGLALAKSGSQPSEALDSQSVIKSQDADTFCLVVKTPQANAPFIVPTCSGLDGLDVEKPYDWSIDWGDGSDENVSGTSSSNSGIRHTYLVPGTYNITISAHGPTEAWLAAFGFGFSSSGANNLDNKAMVISAPSTIRPEMTRTADQVDGEAPPPSYEWSNTFNSCVNLSVAPTFAGWEAVWQVEDGFMESMFYSCTSLETIREGLNFPQNIRTAGKDFAASLFFGCTSLTDLPDGFDLPQSLTSVGDDFGQSMFFGCPNLKGLPACFNLPQGLVSIGDYFANSMFGFCTGLESLPDGFNLPPGIEDAQDGFALNMFANCDCLAGLPDGFNFPQGINHVGDTFAWSMFRECLSLAVLPNGFTFPQNLSAVGDFFATNMFAFCTSLNALPAGFRLPQNLLGAGIYFAAEMFYGAGSPQFQINAEFSFPAGIPIYSVNAFYRIFLLSSQAPRQGRTAASIIGDSPTPMDNRESFDGHFSDLDYIDMNWGGKGLTPPHVGEWGSGDLNGDGLVTMDEVIIALQATVQDIGLTPEQVLALDMNMDSTVTMSDVILMLQKTL
ncbi:MAG: hypothetical protein FWH40_00105 [Coriobacteriia bacterium]|nr:hypothetical protein [Coriobacteriia bacterium]